MLSLKSIFKKTGAVVLRTDDSLMDENVFYLIEKKPSSDTLLLLLKKKQKPVLFVSELEIGNYKNRNLDIRKLEPKDLKTEFKKIRGAIGLNFNGLTATNMERIKKLTKSKRIDISKYLEASREIKTDQEIAKIKTACRITTEIMKKIPEFVEQCKTEKQLALRMEFEVRRNCAENIAFPTIIASGSGSAVPHYATSSRKISKGFMIVDFGVKFNGYCSDITRTFFVGKPNEREIQIFDTIYRAKKAAVKMCCAGNEAKTVHLAAEKIVIELGQKMLHSVGHGIGLRTHDFPRGIHGRSDFVLRNNMVITIEPGYYRKGFGGVRIEDDVVIQKNRCRELSKAENELLRLTV